MITGYVCDTVGCWCTSSKMCTHWFIYLETSQTDGKEYRNLFFLNETSFVPINIHRVTIETRAKMLACLHVKSVTFILF